MREKTDRKNAKLGFFVLISLTLFLVAIFFIGGARDMFNPTFDIYARFSDVGGLTRGNNVWLSGVKIGTVRRVEIISDSLVAVTLRIRENDGRFITKDARATISSDGLIGNPIVVIEPGQMRVSVSEGDTLASIVQVSPQDIMETLQQTGQNLQRITEDVQDISRQIMAGEGTLGRLLTSPELADNLEGAMQNLEQTTQRSARMSRDLDQMVSQMRRNEDGPVHTLMHDTSFSRVYDSLLLNIQTTGRNMSEISRELETLSTRMTDDENALNVILTDTTFANNLQRTMDNAADASRRLDENMEALQHHWLFRGFFRRRGR